MKKLLFIKRQMYHTVYSKSITTYYSYFEIITSNSIISELKNICNLNLHLLMILSQKRLLEIRICKHMYRKIRMSKVFG